MSDLLAGPLGDVIIILSGIVAGFVIGLMYGEWRSSKRREIDDLIESMHRQRLYWGGVTVVNHSDPAWTDYGEVDGGSGDSCGDV